MPPLTTLFKMKHSPTPITHNIFLFPALLFLYYLLSSNVLHHLLIHFVYCLLPPTQYQFLECNGSARFLHCYIQELRGVLETLLRDCLLNESVLILLTQGTVEMTSITATGPSSKGVGVPPGLLFGTVAVTPSVIMFTFNCGMQWSVGVMCAVLKLEDLGMDSTSGTYRYFE